MRALREWGADHQEPRSVGSCCKQRERVAACFCDQRALRPLLPHLDAERDSLHGQRVILARLVPGPQSCGIQIVKVHNATARRVFAPIDAAIPKRVIMRGALDFRIGDPDDERRTVLGAGDVYLALENAPAEVRRLFKIQILQVG